MEGGARMMEESLGMARRRGCRQSRFYGSCREHCHDHGVPVGGLVGYDRRGSRGRRVRRTDGTLGFTGHHVGRRERGASVLVTMLAARHRTDRQRRAEGHDEKRTQEHEQPDPAEQFSAARGSFLQRSGCTDHHLVRQGRRPGHSVTCGTAQAHVTDVTISGTWANRRDPRTVPIARSTSIVLPRAVEQSET